MMKILLFIAIYHIIIHNNMEKMFSSVLFNYNKISRPLDKCKNNLVKPLSCIGMPSGHAELITILSFILYKNNYISLEIAIILIFIFSLQRIISNMHTLNQVCIGIILGFLYGNIYNSFKYSFLIIIIFGFIIANFIIFKIDSIIKNTKIPQWVSKEMYQYIMEKQNISHLFKISYIYYNCYKWNPLFISWNKLEYLMNIIVERINKFEINNSIKFDAIIGIKTGGGILSDYISKKLDIKNYKIKVKKNNCNNKDNINTLINNHFIRSKNDKYYICEEIFDDLTNLNIILIDESIFSSNTINNAFEYLMESKKVKYIYQQCIFINKPDIKYNYIYEKNDPLIFPWGL